MGGPEIIIISGRTLQAFFPLPLFDSLLFGNKVLFCVKKHHKTYIDTYPKLPSTQILIGRELYSSL